MRLGGLCIRGLEEWWGARGEESEGRTQIHSDMEKREMKMKTEGGGRGRHTHAGRQARACRERKKIGREESVYLGEQIKKG